MGLSVRGKVIVEGEGVSQWCIAELPRKSGVLVVDCQASRCWLSGMLGFT
jgi:hypothetical protein